MRRVAFLAILLVLLCASVQAEESQKEPKAYLLFGYSVKPALSGFFNSLVLSEGSDFPLSPKVTLGFELGENYRHYSERVEYRLKVFLNSKFDFARAGQATFYAGAGGGLLGLLDITEDEFTAKFPFAYQGILGFRIGPSYKDKFMLEIHFLNSSAEGGGFQVRVLVGVKHR